MAEPGGRVPDGIASSRQRWWLGALFLLALCVRLGVTARFQGFASPPDESGYPDQIEYDNLAHRLSQGQGYTEADGHATAFRSPGTSLALMPVYLLFGRDYTALRLWFCLLSAATVLPLAWFTGRAFGALAGLCAAAILALDPGHFYYAEHLVSEVPFCLFSTLACATALRAFTARAEGRRSTGWDATTGVLGAFATLARPQFVFVVGLFLLGALLARERRRLLPQVALQAAVFLACLSPWLVRNAVQLGSPTLSTISGYLFFGVHNEIAAAGPEWGTWTRPDALMTADWPSSTDELEYDRRCWRAGLEFLRSRPELLPGLVYHKFRHMLSPIDPTDNVLLRRTWALSWLVSVPLLVGGGVLACRRNRLAFWILGAHIGGVLLLTLVFSGHVRHRHSANPQFDGLAGVCVAALLDLGRRVRRGTERQFPQSLRTDG
jgi:4-amino-4-deoxy-L-arabinose transferase-like glycosyltransferase